VRRYLRDPTFSRFDTIPECDGHTHTHTQTDRHTTTAYTALSKASRGKNDRNQPDRLCIRRAVSAALQRASSSCSHTATVCVRRTSSQQAARRCARCSEAVRKSDRSSPGQCARPTRSPTAATTDAHASSQSVPITSTTIPNELDSFTAGFMAASAAIK